MTTKDYIDTVKVKYPNTYIGFTAFLNSIYPNDKLFINKLQTTGLDYVMNFFIKYIEYRQVSFLEALCNTHFDNPDDNHETLRLKTVTTILHRLEKHIHPVEGQPF